MACSASGSGAATFGKQQFYTREGFYRMVTHSTDYSRPLRASAAQTATALYGPLPVASSSYPSSTALPLANNGLACVGPAAVHLSFSPCASVPDTDAPSQTNGDATLATNANSDSTQIENSPSTALRHPINSSVTAIRNDVICFSCAKELYFYPFRGTRRVRIMCISNKLNPNR